MTVYGGRAVIELEGIERRFGETWALRGLELEVPPGRVVGLLGPNGSGKTTAMRILMGVIAADAGTMRYRGRPVGAEARRRIGYMPEERGLYQSMRAHDQLVYLGRVAGLDRVRARRRATELLGRLGLGDRGGEAVERLSLGNRQRVQLAATLMHEPEALVLDEPFSGLDPLAVDDLGSILTDAAAQGRTVLLSSHQLDLVEDLCEEVAIVDAGRVVLSGPVAELKDRAGGRELHLEVDGAPPGWAASVPGARLVGGEGPRARLALEPGADALRVLDAARAAAPVRGFALRRPPLSEVFREAVGGRR